jgi:hypothetical protein
MFPAIISFHALCGVTLGKISWLITIPSLMMDQWLLSLNMLRLENLKVLSYFISLYIAINLLCIILFPNDMFTYISFIYRSVWPYDFKCMVWDETGIRSTVKRDHWVHSKVISHTDSLPLLWLFILHLSVSQMICFCFYHFSLPESFAAPTQAHKPHRLRNIQFHKDIHLMLLQNICLSLCLVLR